MKKSYIYRRITGLRAFSLLLILTLLLSGVPDSLAASNDPPPQPFETIHLPAQALSVTSVSAPENQSVSVPGLDASLSDLAIADKTSPQAAGDLARQRGLRVSASQVYVQFVIDAGNMQGARRAIKQSGGLVTGASNDGGLLQGWLPIGALESLAAREEVRSIRRPADAVLLELPAAPTTTTEALAVLNAPAWHSAGFTGSGVKVGIIDGGFLGYTSLLGSELPSTVVVKNFVDGESQSKVDGTSNHGTACTEIVHDIAPGAALYLAKIATEIDLQEAVAWLKDTHHVDVISTSLGWFNQTPGDGTGEFADLVQQARNAGILWVTAAGNSRDEHWGGPFNDPDGDGIHNFNGDQNINYFGPGNGNAYLIPPGNTIEAFLRWDDWTYFNQDYNLILWKWNDSLSKWEPVAQSNQGQSGIPGQTPTEELAYVTSAYPSAPYGFTFNRENSNRNVNFEFFAINIASLDETLYSRSLVNLADAPGAVTVAALDVSYPYPQEYYSSEGPTNGPGGSETGGIVKPNISGYTNVSTQSYSEFNGTSAATPHVSGAAALVAGAYPSYTPDQIQAFLQDNAIDMGAPGMDNIYGSGRLFLGDPPGPPQLQPLPDQVLPLNSSSNHAIDLWAYASDNHTPDDQLAYTIDNTPDPSAGVSIENNRYVNINPTGGWQGQTSVTIRVSNPQNMSVTDTFAVFAGILWNGSASSDWHTSTNWTPNSVPTTSDDALITSAPNWPSLNTSAAAINNLRLFPGTALEMTNPNLTVEGVLENYGTISQTQVVTEGLTTGFVHITNLLGTEDKYNGLDILPAGNPPLLPEGASALLKPGSVFTTTVTVAISGNQTCPDRFLGVTRCYQVTPAAPLNASIRFYFTDAERRWYSLGDLVAFRYDAGWIEESGSYGSGGSGDAEFILGPSFSSFSLFSVAKSGEVEAIFLPLIYRN